MIEKNHLLAVSYIVKNKIYTDITYSFFNKAKIMGNFNDKNRLALFMVTLIFIDYIKAPTLTKTKYTDYQKELLQVQAKLSKIVKNEDNDEDFDISINAAPILKTYTNSLLSQHMDYLIDNVLALYNYFTKLELFNNYQSELAENELVFFEMIDFFEKLLTDNHFNLIKADLILDEEIKIADKIYQEYMESRFSLGRSAFFHSKVYEQISNAVKMVIFNDLYETYIENQ